MLSAAFLIADNANGHHHGEFKHVANRTSCLHRLHPDNGNGWLLLWGFLQGSATAIRRPSRLLNTAVFDGSSINAAATHLRNAVDAQLGVDCGQLLTTTHRCDRMGDDWAVSPVSIRFLCRCSTGSDRF